MGQGSIKVFNSTGKELGLIDYVTSRIWLILKYVVVKEMDPVLKFPKSLKVNEGNDEVVYALLRKKVRRRNFNG